MTIITMCRLLQHHKMLAIIDLHNLSNLQDLGKHRTWVYMIRRRVPDCHVSSAWNISNKQEYNTISIDLYISFARNLEDR